MKLRFILKTLILEINRSMGSFIITAIMLGISLALFYFEAVMYIQPIYRYTVNRSVLSVSDQQLYIINMEYYKMFWSEEETENYYEFIKSLNDDAQGISAGIYYLDNMNANLEVLGISKEIMQLGKLSDIEGKEIVLERNSAAVGYAMKEEYPIGTVIIDEESGAEYVVTQILKKDCRWLSSGAVNGVQTAIDLNHMLVINADTDLESGGYLNILNAANNAYLYHSTMSREDINQYIKNHAEKYDIRVYESISLKEKSKQVLLYDYKSESVTLFFAVVCFFISLFAQFLLISMNLEYRKYLFGVLLANGWSGKDIQRFSLMECGIRLLISLCVAIPVSFLFIKNLLIFQTYADSFYHLLPFFLVITMLLYVSYHKWIVNRLSNYKIKKLLEGENRR